jgi:hypothetical protein
MTLLVLLSKLSSPLPLLLLLFSSSTFPHFHRRGQLLLLMLLLLPLHLESRRCRRREVSFKPPARERWNALRCSVETERAHNSNWWMCFLNNLLVPLLILFFCPLPPLLVIYFLVPLLVIFLRCIHQEPSLREFWGVAFLHHRCFHHLLASSSFEVEFQNHNTVTQISDVVDLVCVFCGMRREGM